MNSPFSRAAAGRLLMVSLRRVPAVLLLSALPLTGLAAEKKKKAAAKPAVAERSIDTPFGPGEAELDKLFCASAAKERDEAAHAKLVSMGDGAVDFLVKVIREQKKHPVEFYTVEGKQRTMGTWSQEASSILMAIDTPKVVTAARTLVEDGESEIRFWGGWILRGCDTQRLENCAFFRARLEKEDGRCLQEIIDHLAERRDSADLPAFKKVLATNTDLHVRLSLWQALALQGDKDALVEIVKVCEAGGGHLGVVYLGRATGEDFGWDMEAWRAWLDKTSAEDFLKLARKALPAPLPPLPAGQPRYEVPAAAPAEIREALAWYDSLGLPSTKDLVRVRITDEYGEVKAKEKQEKHMTAWVLSEKDGVFRLLAGPDVEAPFSPETGDAWPLREWEVKPEKSTKDGWSSVRRVEKSDFRAEAAALLARLKKPPSREDWPSRFGMVLSERAAVFVTGHDCLERGDTELGMDLLERVPPMGRDVNELRSLAQMLADEMGQAALWRVTLRFGVADVSREALLAEVDRALKQFPTSSSADRLREMSTLLSRMVEEDRAHAAPGTPLEKMTKEEQVKEWIFRLRDQNGRQVSQPGWCDIFSMVEPGKGTTPADHLVNLGRAAVPELIASLGDVRYSRSVGFWRDFRFSHTVLTTGDCALTILECIAGKRFFEVKTTSSYMSKEDGAKATREAVEKWWEAERKKGGN